MATIAPTAVVDRGAELHVDVEIGPYAIIGPNVRIGPGSTVGAHAVVDGYTAIGRDCRIFPHAAVGLEPQDLKFKGGECWLRIGDRTTVREFATLHPATHEGEATVVGADCLLMAYSHVAHNCVLGDHVILANAANLAGHVLLEEYAVVGGVTPVHQFVRIGAHAMVGGGSRVPQDVAPYTRVAGIPPRTFGLNTVGLTRRGFSPDTVAALKQVYRLFFREKLSVIDAAARVRAEVPPLLEVEHFVRFFLTSERGVTR
jgi:UDP-N-acetylglucosamine acyltransferase